MDVVQEWADMVKCRPVDLGPSFARRLKKLEGIILEAAAKVCDDEWVHAGSLCRSKCAGDLAKAIRALRSDIQTDKELQR